MSGLPWSKFFWSDYASDPALKLCSFAAQGLWMRMLCIAAEHEPPGYVAVNGRGLDNEQIARCTGGAASEVCGLLSELENNGVFSRDRRGWIYSRRIVTEAKRRRKAAEDGKKGGNPRLCKQTGKTATLKGKDKGSLNGHANPHMPEARNQSEEEPNGSFVEKLRPEHVVEIWNKRAEEWGLAQVKTLSRERLQRLNARIREHPLEDFMAAFDAIARSGFLRGDNKNGWKADFDFFTQKSSFIKLVEGSYDH